MESVTITNEKLLHPATIGVISDLHYSKYRYCAKYLEYVLKKIKLLSPDYICIPGDIFDQAEDIDLPALLNFFRLLLLFCQKDIVISYGNHDLFVKGSHGWEEGNPTYLFNSLASLSPRIKILKNDRYVTEENICFIGTFEDFSFYEQFHENSKMVQSHYQLLLPQLVKQDSCNGLLTHSPALLRDEVFGAIDAMKDIQFLIAGHYHAGMLPSFLKPFVSFFSSQHNGLISPQGEFFPPYAYGILQKDELTAIISEGVVKCNPDANILYRMINHVYTPDVKAIRLVPKKK